ncbi:hypothetical protein CK203_088369 [Vitis vinifera]|uniref:Uncharacterized protein n=1 Tax=Vitis vinifera TaxID=29760 RepID=A0A438DP45_VITVI|nr:hypothetical protein CK203_088369 [Vitis vinifera]
MANASILIAFLLFLRFGNLPMATPSCEKWDFSSSNVAEALVMYDNDTDKALAHFLNSSS